MTRAMLILVLVAASGASTAAPVSEMMLRDDATPAVAAALDVTAALPDGSHLNARIDRDRVLVTAGPADAPALSVALIAAAEAPDGAPTANGTALVAEPGPAPEALVTEVLARLARAQPIPWRAVSLWRLRGGPVADTLGRAAHLLDRGEVAAARALVDDVAATGSGERIRLAAMRMRLGQKDEARAAVAGLKVHAPSNRALVAAVAGDEVDAGSISGERACEFADVAQALGFTGRREPALAVARAVRTADPACGSAWVTEMESALALDSPDVQSIADAALKAAPEDPTVVEGASAVWTATGDAVRAVRSLEPLVVAGGRHGPAILVGPFCRDKATMDTLVPELEARLVADPKDEIARYLVGVAMHYANEFGRSNDLLLGLEPRWPEDQRLQIYVAMNDFNLGRTDAALQRLNRAAEAPVVDLDVFYCRAEVVRNTDPGLALADLKRTAALARAHPGHSAEKDTRLEALMSALEACIATGERPCGGPWEHPRQSRGIEASTVEGPPVNLLVALAALAAVLIVVVALWRRRVGR